MDVRLVGRLIVEKLNDSSTYVVAVVVGTLINLYGQLLVPWFRTGSDPVLQFTVELTERPELTIFSMFLAFAFPFCVGTYSAVATRYKNRRVESIADFPEKKPDPVFRAAKDGSLVEVGGSTQLFFEEFGIDRAQTLLGEDVWLDIISGRGGDRRIIVEFEQEGERYVVAHTPTKNDEINIYMTRLSGLTVFDAS